MEVSPGIFESPQTGSGCAACKHTCLNALGSCLLGVGLGCAPFLDVPVFGAGLYAICFGIGAYICVGIQDTCNDVCDSGGHDCCPVPCKGTDASGLCCNAGNTCLDPTVGTCCQIGQTACLDKECCDNMTEACVPSTGGCCALTNVICAGVCCKPGQACFSSTTSAPPTCGTCTTELCGQECCPSGTACASFAQSLCCLPKTICTNGTCCNGDQTCTGPTNLKFTCCDDADTCNGGSLCCGINSLGMQEPCLVSDSNPSQQTCCSSSALVCGTNCCDDPARPACQADGTCGP